MGTSGVGSSACAWRGRSLEDELLLPYSGSTEVVSDVYLMSAGCPTTTARVPPQTFRGRSSRIEALIRASELPSCAVAVKAGPNVGDSWVGPWSGYVARWVPPTGPGGATLGSLECRAGAHTVELSKGLWAGEVEVSQALWEREMGTGWRARNAEYKGVSLLGGTLPVHSVSWCEAVSFANAVSLKDGLALAYSGTSMCSSTEGLSVTWTGDASGWRLPTEAEGEWSARGGVVGGPYATRSGGGEALCEFANVSDASARAKFSWKPENTLTCDDGFPALMPVGTKLANGYGLKDMTGNVWEWSWNVYVDTPEAGRDPQGPSATAGAPGRAYLGGSWWTTVGYDCVALRGWRDPASQEDMLVNTLGVRLVRSVP